MRIVLTTGISGRVTKTKIVRPGYSFPLALGYLARMLERVGHEVIVKDYCPLNWSAEAVVEEIVHYQPDVVAFSLLSSNYPGACEMIRLLKMKKNMPIIVGGVHCTLFPDESLRGCPLIDFLVVGEGETTFVELVRKLESGGNPYEAPGIAYLDGFGQTQMSVPRTSDQKPESLPFPIPSSGYEWSLYSADPVFATSDRMVNVICSRGCFYSRCSFCSRTGTLYVPFRRRPVMNVIEELKELFRDHQPSEIAFVDDNFTDNEEWVTELCRKMFEGKLNFKWSCFSRVDTLSEKLAHIMSKHGCYIASIGFESGSQRLLDMTHKGTTLEQARQAVMWLSKAGIQIFGSWILGLPTETRAEIELTIRFALSLDIQWAQFVPLHPLPGTPLHRVCEQQGQMTESEELYRGGNDIIYHYPSIGYISDHIESARDLNSIITNAYRRFYFRPRIIKEFAARMKTVQIFRGYLRSLLFFLKMRKAI